ncbi:hypothetical protein BGZ58_003213 [Dissophora ornata]|nr:hypothetical protein BGZ58_003213 [Dissophora ornata]
MSLVEEQGSAEELNARSEENRVRSRQLEYEHQSLAVNSKDQYKIYYRFYMKFCDDHYQHETLAAAGIPRLAPMPVPVMPPPPLPPLFSTTEALESRGNPEAHVQLQACARKQLNNRKRIVEEVEFLVTQELEESQGCQSRELALTNAMERLDGVRVQHKWSINQLVKYCRQQSEGRKGKGKGKGVRAKDDAGSAGAGENLAGASNDDDDDDDDDDEEG